MTETNPMIARFQKVRWCPARHSIHDLKPGQHIHFDSSHYYNVKSTVERLNDAYRGLRKWMKETHHGKITVKRLK